MNAACPQCKNKEKQSKILQADLEFEIKRMREDLAEQKVLMELNYQKEQKKCMEKYYKQKHEREEENKKWIAKYDHMLVQYQSTISNLEQRYQRQISILKIELANEYEARQLQKTGKFKKEIENLNKNYNNELTDLKEKQSFQINLIKRKNEKTVSDLTETHFQKIGEVTFEHEQKLKKLRKEIDEVVQSRDNLKKQAHQKQTSLYQQIYQRKQEISSLKYEIDQLNVTITNCEEEIKFKKLEIQALKDQHQAQLETIQQQYLTEKSNVIQSFQKQIENLLLKKLEDCEQFQQNVKEIEVKRQNELKIYQTYIQEVKQLVEQRPSRNEDVEQITILKDLLNRKEKQFQKVVEQVKNYRLQLQYKEETFNRIFKTNVNPLSIEKIGKKRELKLTRASYICRQNSTKYSSSNNNNTMQAITLTGCEFRKDKSIEPKSNKMF